jgi:hypothetical protein
MKFNLGDNISAISVVSVHMVNQVSGVPPQADHLKPAI